MTCPFRQQDSGGERYASCYDGHKEREDDDEIRPNIMPFLEMKSAPLLNHSHGTQRHSFPRG